jgi:asparagine synthase (glutamine-hydrolysing)
MCGIAGGYALNAGAVVDRARVEAMSRAVAHRGPDGEGLWVGDRACLAHRRLAVIDLATGQQPMVTEDGRTAIDFNGEIYNYVELRAELVAQGETLHTQSDTEVLLLLLQREGIAALARLRGMFAFAFADPERLVLARDRIGKKPLYYTIDDGVLYFASSFQAVRSGLPGPARIDAGAVAAFLDLAYVPAPGTIDPRIRKLEAGTVALAGNGEVVVQRYWDADAEPEPFGGTREQAVDRLDELLNEAVAMRLRSDVPLGVFLSGGVDSSLVAAVAARVAPESVLTFSIGFDVAGFDETTFAAQVARRIGSEHRTFRLHADGMALLPDLVRHYGEPFGDASAIPTWLLSRETRRHVTVAVGGDGGDEGFGGYEWYRTAARLRRMRRALTPALASAGSHVLARAQAPRLGRIRRGVSILALQEAARFAALRRFMDRSEAEALYRGELADAWRAGPDGNERLIRSFETATGSPLRRMRVVDIRTYLADCLMPKIDVASMAHGLEVRAPLLDHEILHFALSLPDAWISDRAQGKRILRSVLDRYLPRSLFERPKHGFDVPLSAWFNQELRARIDALETSPALHDRGWFRAERIRALAAEHRAGVRDHSQRLYNLIILDEWLKIA